MPTPSWTASFTTLIAWNSPANPCAGISPLKPLDQLQTGMTSSPNDQMIHLRAIVGIRRSFVTRLIHQQHAVSARFDGERYLGRVQRHGLGVAEGQHASGEDRG